MRHFFQYHNPDTMGKFCPSKKTFGIVTNKLKGVQQGDTVWLVTGEGRPREYSLCETFEVETVGPETGGRFKYRVSGSDGRPLSPRKIDKSSHWFQELLRLTANFRYGFQPISSRAVIEGLGRVGAT